MPNPALIDHDPQYWQERAAKMRALAEEQPDGQMRGMLLEIAWGFGFLAQCAKKRCSERISITI